MNFLADEGVDRQIVTRLRSDGYSVLYVAEMEPGVSDDFVLDVANRESAVLVTADKDFGETVVHGLAVFEGHDPPCGPFSRGTCALCGVGSRARVSVRAKPLASL